MNPAKMNAAIAEAHLPYNVSGPVVKGFGRGSKEIGIPTANYPESVVDLLPADFPPGIYFGWANIDNGPVYKMVMSVGWNPFYSNEKKSMETHIIHEFKNDFYGSNLKIIILGYLRPEKSFHSLDELIIAIKHDVAAATSILDKPEYLVFRDNAFFFGTNNNENDKL